MASNLAVQKSLTQSTQIMNNADVSLEVEGHVLAANKGVLSCSSPVFTAMFKQNFKEMDSHQISLPGKSYIGIYHFIEVTHIQAPVTSKNVDVLIPIAHEYQCENILKACDTVVSQNGKYNRNTPSMFQTLLLSIKYDLPATKASCISNSHIVTYEDLMEFKTQNSTILTPEIMLELLEANLKSKDSTLQKMMKLMESTLYGHICGAESLEMIYEQRNSPGIFNFTPGGVVTFNRGCKLCEKTFNKNLFETLFKKGDRNHIADYYFYYRDDQE